MTALTGALFTALAVSRRAYVRTVYFFATLLAFVFCFSIHASAQTTTISGTVFDPRTTASALPLPGVLVYVTTSAVSPLPSGVQCLTYSAPTGVVSFTYTGVDGKFTLDNVPANSAYTLVIQAGKWRRQFPETVNSRALSGLNLHMPSNHSEGDIPMIAIATGAADGVECVLHDMGIADSEFTDDNGTTNAGGHIHLYQGSGSSGAVITPSTPSDTVLTGDMAKLNSYDMVMFPCQGGPYIQSDAALSNVVNYTSAGGRIFSTHFSYVWLDPDSPYNSQFPPVANWRPKFTYPAPDPGVATINTSFSDAATMAQWLQNVGATYSGKEDQIQIGALRHDIDAVIPPTQSWLTLNDPADNNPVMQITFNTPVNAAAANQCGRVLFTEYHVKDLNGQGLSYPNECPSGPMNAQEEMLEYALFDLSAFVKPVVVPTLSVSFDPSPLFVKQNEDTQQVTINITNTSSSTAIDASAMLSIALPNELTAVQISDPTNGWNCAVGTLKCTRTTGIPRTMTDTVTLTLKVGTYPQGGLTSPTGTLKATVSSPTFSNDVTATDTIVFQQKAPVSWPTPAAVIYGTALSGLQLNASSTLPGTFTYMPALGAVLPVGQQTLTAVFNPADETDYTPSTSTVTLTVVPVTPAILVTPSPNPAFLSNGVTITASIATPSSTPSGTVVFYDGTTALGTSQLNGGLATLTTSALGTGTHTITAVYSGDANYHASTSTAMSETIQDFAIAVTPASSDTVPTVYPGGPATYSLLISPLGGATLPDALQLAVDGLPPTSTVEFSPAIVAAHSGETNITMTVKTPALAISKPAESPLGNGIVSVAFGLLVIPFVGRIRRARRWIQVFVLTIAGAAFSLGVTGCGITYTPHAMSLTITAKSGHLTHTAAAKIKVQ